MKIPFSKAKDNRKRRRVVRNSDNHLGSYSTVNKSRYKDKKKPENHRAKTRLKRNILRYSILAVIVVVLGFIFWSNSRINRVVMSGSSQEKYTEVIEGYLSRNPVANFKPLVSISAIADNITSIFPEVAGVSVEIPIFGDQLNANVAIRKDQLVLKTGANDYFIVDQDGYAYARFDTKKGFEGVLVLSDDTDVKYQSDANGQFVSPLLVSFIQSVNKGLGELENFKGQSFSFRLTDEARVVYARPSGFDYQLKFDEATSVEQQMSNLSSALGYLKAKSTVPSKYIDVRINGTVYYK